MDLSGKNKVQFSAGILTKAFGFTLMLMTILALAMVCLVLVGCSSSDDSAGDGADRGGQITGTVKDENGGAYPGTTVTASKGSESLKGTTDSNGSFSLNTKDEGSYQIEAELPLSTEAVSANPFNVNVSSGGTAPAELVIRPKTVAALLNFGNVDIFNEIRNENGNTASGPDTPIYAANFFQEPIGMLTAIKAPDGHHVTLSEWIEAKGSLDVSCDGNSATVKINLEGLIPHGTYTFWLAFLNNTKRPGQDVTPSDFVHTINPPLKSGTDNVQIADAEGKIETSIIHPSCILTDEVALVIPIIYHINGNTFGAGVIPDVEEVSHLLAYFQ